MGGSEIDIVQERTERASRSYRTCGNCQIVSYMGFDGGKEEEEINKAVQCICIVK